MISNLINLQKDAKENEASFQSNYDLWQKTQNKRNWDEMWMSVYITCLNICKKIYKSRKVIIEDEELVAKATDSAAYVMKFVRKGVRPDKLSSYCYLRCLRFIQNPKDVWYETNVTQMPQDNYKDIDMEIEDKNA
jgi:hypothetical protein